MRRPQQEVEEDCANLSGTASSSLMVSPTDGPSYGATSDTDSESILSLSRGTGLSTQELKIRCKKMFVNRVPKGKGPLIIFVLNIVETFCFNEALHLINHSLFGGKDDIAKVNAKDHAMQVIKGAYVAETINTTQATSEAAQQMHAFLYFSLFHYTVGRLFYPFAGLLADMYLGRHRVMQLGWWLFWCGFAIYLISQVTELNKDTTNSAFMILPVIMTVVLILGSACVEATIIPFGMDQVRQGASSEELSSYFFWYYFGRQLGYISNVLLYLLLTYLFFKVGSYVGVYESDLAQLRKLKDITTALIAIILISAAILFQFFAGKWLFKAKQRGNPLKLILGVLFFAATVKRQAPRYRRSFRYGEGRLPRIELAKLEYDGTYSSEEVEDVKTFVRLLFIIICLGATFICYAAVYAMYNVMLKDASDEDIVIIHDHKRHSPFDFFSLTEPIMVCLVILVINHLILPFFPDISMKRRLGIGALFMVLSILSATVLVISYKKLKYQFFWIFLPVGFFSVADTCIFVTGLEFITAQSPDSMKGLLIGLFYCIFGIFSSVGIIIYYKLYDAHNVSLGNFFYVMLAISIVGVAVYVLGSLCYKNRQRPTNDDSEQDLINRSIAASVYLSGRH